MNKLFFAILMSIAQLGFAGQLHEIDVTHCPAELHIYQGDTLRFFNPATEKNSAGVRSALFNSLSLVPGDHYDYTFGPSTFLESPVVLSYNCGNYLSPSYLHTDVNVLPKIILSNAPVAIYPKQHLITRSKAFDVGIYVITEGSWNPVYLKAIKGISIKVDGVLFFEGDMNAYEAFVIKQGFQFYDIFFGCDLSNFQPFCAPVLEGYRVADFTIPAKTFKQGKHVIQAKLTMTSEKGDVYYEDKGEYIVYQPTPLFP